MSNLKALLERVEKATGPDRELDGAIAAAFGKPHGPHEYIEDRSFISTEQQADCFTSSLDAVLSLVEEKLPGWHESVSTMTKDGVPQAQLAEPTDTQFGPGIGIRAQTSGATRPVALLTALLRALIAKQETEAKIDG